MHVRGDWIHPCTGLYYNSFAMPCCPHGKSVCNTQLAAVCCGLDWSVAAVRILFDGDDAIVCNTVRKSAAVDRVRRPRSVWSDLNSYKTNVHKSEISTKINVFSCGRAHNCASCSAWVICRGCGVVTCNKQPSIY